MTAMLSARTNATNETRQVGKQSGGDSGCCLGRRFGGTARSPYMNAVSRKNLTDARAVNANDVPQGARHRRRIRRCHQHRAVSADDGDMHVGRERPLEGPAWGEEGRSQMGVARPRCLSARLRQRRGLRYRRHRAPPASDPRPLTGKNIEPRLSCKGERRHRLRERPHV
jgi:hypothetical protein